MSLTHPNLSNLTETAQKNLTAISNKISIQKKIIEKERAVLDTKGDTYVCSRARTSLAFKKSKLDKLAGDIQDKKEKLEKEFNEALKQLDRDLEVKSRQLEAEIEIQDKIIWDETHRETPTIIRANTEIQLLTKEKEKLLSAAGVFTSEQSAQETLPTPPHTLPENERVCVAPPQDIPAVSEQSIDFALFMMDGRQDGQPIDPNPSYLNHVAYGLCMTKSDKVKKGVKMP